MKCPSCGSGVEEGADLCLECGEPMGDGVVAQAVRREEANTSPLPKIDPFPMPTVVRTARPPPPPPAPVVAKRKRRVVDDEPELLRCPGCGLPTKRDRCPSCATPVRRLI